MTTSDIVERLREAKHDPDMQEAADEIDRLRDVVTHLLYIHHIYPSECDGCVKLMPERFR